MTKIQTVTIRNSYGMVLEVSNYGATITKLAVLDKRGKPINVVISLNSIQDYLSPPYSKELLFFGCTIGRYAGRISTEELQINNELYPIFNENGVHLHGGKEGFDKKIWSFETVNQGEEPYIILTYLSKHLDEGYPGNLKITACFKLLESNALKITYKAETDMLTHVNLTNHSYFNLDGSGSIIEHQLKIESNKYVEVDKKLIPTGKVLNSLNTRFDFNEMSKIGRQDFDGFDDTFVLNKNKLKATTLSSSKSGIKLEIYTNQPTMVIHAPVKFLKMPFRNNVSYSKFPAICFEAQNFPDAPNNEQFRSSLLKPDDTYTNETLFKFTLISKN